LSRKQDLISVTDGFVDYHSTYDYTHRILQVTDSIASLLNRGHAPAVIELTEYALAQLEKAIGDMDDSDGYMNDLLPELQNLHHRASWTLVPNLALLRNDCSHGR
jgi:hypothetical protein